MKRPCSERTAIAYAEVYHACRFDLDELAPDVFPFGWNGTTETDNPYRGVRGMRTAARRGPFLVSDVEHNGAFIGNDHRNLVFRAHHDALHLLTGKGFELPDEIAVCMETLDRLTLSRDAAAVIVAELIGQASYYAWHGAFPLTVDGLQPIFHVTDERVRTVDRDAYAGKCWGEYETDGCEHGPGPLSDCEACDGE